MKQTNPDGVEGHKSSPGNPSHIPITMVIDLFYSKRSVGSRRHLQVVQRHENPCAKYSKLQVVAFLPE